MYQNKPLTYISLFSCAGVGCYGFKMNGFECVATNELLDARLSVQRANHKCKYESGYISGDITLPETQKQLFEEINKWKQLEGISGIDVVMATPPCQGMSTANYKKTDTEQVRNSLVVEAIKLIRDIRPKVFIFENVRAFLKTICTDVDGEDKPIEESILNNLSPDYNIFWKIINFKDYGVPSSRPRTLVIGTLKDYHNLSPLFFFPSRSQEITLRQAIGSFSSLGYGERDRLDPLHFARVYPIEQLEWIKNLAEGQSAFEQDVEFQPGRVDEGGNKIVNKGAYMGNKYRRLTWDKVCSCIHTRNDVMSSQDTIHPSDNRVLSIRELMRVMTIPDSFLWTFYDNMLTVETAPEYLKQNELNIRRCIGEAVPTQIIKDISEKIKNHLNQYQDYSKTSSDIFHQIKDIDLVKKDTVNIQIKDKEPTINLIEQIVSLFTDKKEVNIWTNSQSLVDRILLNLSLPSNINLLSQEYKGIPDYLISNNILKPYTQNIQLSLFDADFY